jgi:uncharacterized membrane protein
MADDRKPAAQPEQLPVKGPAGNAVIEIGERATVPAPATQVSTAIGASEPEQSSQYQLEPALPVWVLAVLVGAMILAVGRAYTRTTRRISTQRRVALASIRILGILILIGSLARPVLVESRILREDGLCVIAMDTSSSMEIRDCSGGRSRWNAAITCVKESNNRLSELQKKFELQRYTFDSTASRVSQLPGESGRDTAIPSPGGSRTDLATLLDTITAEVSGVSAAGALIISDGRHNAPIDVIPSALALQRAGVPVYCVGVGWDSTPTYYRDVRIKDLVVPEKAFIGSRMVIRVEIESTLPNAAAVPLTIEVAGKKIHEGNVLLKQGTNVVAVPVEATYMPAVLGAHRVVATLGTLVNEADTDNNSRSAFFRVYRSKLGIWYVEGAIRKEFGSIRSALETAPNVKLRALNAFASRTLSEKELLPTTPEDQSQLRLVIIGDIQSERFVQEDLRALAKWVEEGGAVLMIGGMSNFGAGKWHHTPLDPVLPVEMTLADGVSNGPFRISVAEMGEGHPVLAIGDSPQQSAERWRSLPPLPGINNVKGIKPAARVLLSADNRPLLVVQEYGKGRSAVFTADTTWQWVLKANQGDAHKRFWRNLATWLTRSDYRDTDKAVFADAERLHCEVGQEVAFNAFVHATEATGPAIKDARIVLSLMKVQGQTETPVFKEDSGRGPGEFRKVVLMTAAGSYRFRAAAIGLDGKTVDSDSVDIQVTAPNLEQDNPRANLKLLRRISEMTGGAYFESDRAADAFSALLKREAGYSKPVKSTTDLWNHPAVLVLFILLLTSEWSLRKRWGLI